MDGYRRSRRRRYEPHTDVLEELLEAHPDEGCEVSPSCLNCPLPQCRYDTPGGLRGYRRQQRDAEISVAHEGGATVTELVWRFAVADRTIHRALQRVREGAA